MLTWIKRAADAVKRLWKAYTALVKDAADDTHEDWDGHIW